MIPTQGFLRLHIQNAHLEVNRGTLLNKQDPVVLIKVGGHQEWRSAVCVDGGKNPVWQNQFMEIPVKKLKKLDKEVDIKIFDQNLFGKEPLGHAKVTLGLFAARVPSQNRVELRYNGQLAGHIMIASLFHNENIKYVGSKSVNVVVQPAPVVIGQAPMQQQYG